MCEQCLAKTDYWELFPGDPVKPNDQNQKSFTNNGWALVRATQDGSYMMKGDWGLVRVNDPDVIFTTDPMVDPSQNMSDEEVNALSNEEYHKVDSFYVKLSEFREELEMSPGVGHHLVEKAKQNGYDGSTNFEYWLFTKLGELIQSKPSQQEAHE